MAQIKTYQQRQGLPTETGVQLQVTPAQSNVGTSLFELGTQFGQIGDRLDLAQDNRDISTSTLNATVKLQDLETELSTADPRIARGSYQGRADQIFQEASGGLSGRALDKFTQNFNQLSVKSRFSVKSASVTRHRQQLEGGLETTLAGLVRAAGNSQMLSFRLRGAQIAKGDIIKTGITDIDNMVAQGVVKADWAARRKLKFLKNVAGAGISSRLRKAPLAELNTLVDEMRTDKIKDSEIADYWKQLDEKEKLDFQKKVLSTHEIQLNIIEKQQTRNVAGLLRKYGRNYGKHMNKILLAHEDPDNNEMPTSIEITKALADDDIGATEYNKLKAALVNIDPAGSSQPYITEIMKRIRTAPNKAEITKIIEEMESTTGPRGKLQFKHFQILERRALDQINKTPVAKRSNIYSKALDKILASTDFMDKVFPGVKERGARVRIDFEGRLADGANDPNFDPAEAFTEALEAFRTRGTININAIPRPQFGPAKKLNDWTLKEVNDAIAETKIKFKGKTNTLTSQLDILISLAAYLGAKGKAIGDAESQDEKAGTIKSRLKKAYEGQD